jgi:hypothetical protein
MPTDYVKRITILQPLPPNTGTFKTKHLGVRIYSTNRNYIHKKSHVGVIIGTDLVWEDCVDIQKLFRLGCKKKSLCQKYNITRYYLEKVLSMPLEGCLV